MYSTSKQFAEINKSNVEQVTKFAAVALQNLEKVFLANVEAAKFALAQGVERAGHTASVKDVEALATSSAKYIETDVQAVLAYSRNLYEIAQQTQAQYTALGEEAVAAFKGTLESWRDSASKVSADPNAAVNAFRSTFAAATAAFEQFKKSTNEAVALAA